MSNKVHVTYWIELWLANEKLSRSSKKNYSSTLQKYFSYEQDVIDLLETTLDEVIDTLLEKAGTTNDKTLNEHFNRVRKFLIWYSNRANIKPMYKLESISHKYVNNTNPIILSKKEIAVACLAMDPSERATFLAYLDTGIRKEEISQLKPSDFKEKKQVNIFSSKTSTERSVYAVSDMVIEIIEEHDVTSFVSPATLAKKFKEILRKNEIYITFNILRHTFATKISNNGGNPMWLSKVMGNSLEVILNNYYHNNPEEIKSQLDDIVNKKVNYKTKDAYIAYLEATIEEYKDKYGN